MELSITLKVDLDLLTSKALDDVRRIEWQGTGKESLNLENLIDGSDCGGF